MQLPTWLNTFVDLLRPPRPRYAGISGARSAGMWVDDFTAIANPGVWACVRLISRTIACLDWHILRVDPTDGTKQRLNGTRDAMNVDRILNERANPETNAFNWREMALAHVLLTGNHFSEIERDNVGRPIALWPIVPERVLPRRDEKTGQLIYRCWSDYGGETIIDARNMLHLKGLGWDGLTGFSVVTLARRSIGAALAMDEYNANFYGNNTQLGLALEHPKALSETARDRLKKDLAEKYTGPGNAFRALVLEEGMKMTRPTMTMIDAQWVDSRKFGLSEICRWFGVPLHKIAELDRATFSNIEHQSIEYVQDAILPWCRCLEQETDIKLFGRANRAGTFTRLNINSLLRGDMKSRGEAYALGRQWGWYSVNDVRRMENEDGIGPEGDVYLQPMNMQPAGETVAEDADDDEPATPFDDRAHKFKASVTWLRERRRTRG